MNEKCIGWLARDESGELYLYKVEPPTKMERFGLWGNYLSLAGATLLLEELFPEVTWEDKFPTKVEVEVEYKIRRIDDGRKTCWLVSKR